MAGRILPIDLAAGDQEQCSERLSEDEIQLLEAFRSRYLTGVATPHASDPCG